MSLTVVVVVVRVKGSVTLSEVSNGGMIFSAGSSSFGSWNVDDRSWDGLFVADEDDVDNNTENNRARNTDKVSLKNKIESAFNPLFKRVIIIE